MFLTCPDIVEIDLSNFDSSKLTHMHAMFFGCTSLTSIKMSNFNAPLAKNINRMFYNCKSLVSIDISNFTLLKEINVNGIFEGCTSLEYVNARNLILNNNLEYSNIFSGIQNKLVFCSKSRKWNEVLGGNDFLNCFDIYVENSENDFKCYKNGPIQQNVKSICQKCGQNYISINKDINNNDNSLINCYKTKEGFYLYVNGSTPIFLPCYRSCKICQIRGNKTYHNCIVCKDNYQLELIYEIYINCYISNFKKIYK